MTSLDDFLKTRFTGGRLIRIAHYDEPPVLGTITSIVRNNGTFRVKTSRDDLLVTMTLGKMQVREIEPMVYRVNPGWDPPVADYVFIPPRVISTRYPTE